MRQTLLIFTIVFLSTFVSCGQSNQQSTQEVLPTFENDTSDKKNIDQKEVIITLKDEVLGSLHVDIGPFQEYHHTLYLIFCEAQTYAFRLCLLIEKK